MLLPTTTAPVYFFWSVTGALHWRITTGFLYCRRKARKSTTLTSGWYLYAPVKQTRQTRNSSIACSSAGILPIGFPQWPATFWAEYPTPIYWLLRNTQKKRRRTASYLRLGFTSG